jgi:hypothetical protein
MNQRTVLAAVLLMGMCAISTAQSKQSRISLTPRSNVSTSEVGKELDKYCRTVIITDDVQKADYQLEAWDTGSGAGRKPYKFTLFQNGDRVFSTETRGLEGAVKDVCGFISGPKR